MQRVKWNPFSKHVEQRLLRQPAGYWRDDQLQTIRLASFEHSVDIWFRWRYRETGREWYKTRRETWCRRIRAVMHPIYVVRDRFRRARREFQCGLKSILS